MSLSFNDQAVDRLDRDHLASEADLMPMPQQHGYDTDIMAVTARQ
jgi:hypothetical protein